MWNDWKQPTRTTTTLTTSALSSAMFSVSFPEWTSRVMADDTCACLPPSPSGLRVWTCPRLEEMDGGESTAGGNVTHYFGSQRRRFTLTGRHSVLTVLSAGCKRSRAPLWVMYARMYTGRLCVTTVVHIVLIPPILGSFSMFSWACIRHLIWQNVLYNECFGKSLLLNNHRYKWHQSDKKNHLEFWLNKNIAILNQHPP